jgi:antitoxin component YwqK of YwqJK toxin-antitoxin module
MQFPVKFQHFSFLLAVFLLVALSAEAQKLPKIKKPKKKEREHALDMDSLSAIMAPTIDLEEEEEEEEETKKKKRKKKVFYGMRTKKGRISRMSGGKQLYEEFYYLKEYVEPDYYVREKFYYDPEDRKIKYNTTVKNQDVLILHGPYKRYLDGQLIADGIFYIGTKHGRWMEYFSNDVLRNKEKYFKGWPKESEITYYDAEATKVKEVIPIQHGKREGTYYYFHDNGVVGVTGDYQNDLRVGVWKEYYKYRRNRRNQKKEVQYSEDGYNQEFRPFILKEWSQEGKLLYDRSVRKRKLNQS